MNRMSQRPDDHQTPVTISDIKPPAEAANAGPKQADGKGKRNGAIISAEWSGPVPPPNILEAYDRLVPGSAEKIINNWTAESEHRRQMDRRVIAIEERDRPRSRYLAFIFSIIALVTTIVLGFLGQEIAASIVGGGTLVGVVAAFLSARKE